MFGIFYGLFTLFAHGATKASNIYEDNKRRCESEDIGDITYFYRGEERYTKTGRRVFRTKDTKGHDILVDADNGHFLHDFTLEKRKKANLEAMAKGKTTRYALSFDCTLAEKKGALWRKAMIVPTEVDIKTGRLINCVYINHIGFYMDLSTGHLLRKTDDEICEDTEKINRMITLFNERQERLKNDPRYGEDRWWMEKEFFLASFDRAFMDDNGNVVFKK